jgi:hypothetical protein
LKHEKRRDGGSNVIDKRVIERQIRKGKLDASAYRRTLEALPDVSDRVARDADGEPSRSAVSASSVSGSAHARAPEAPDQAPDGALDDEDDDEEEDEGDIAPDATPASY